MPARLAIIRPAPHSRHWSTRKSGLMLDFYSHLWSWLLACLILGAATGALAPHASARLARARKKPARWLLWTGLAFLAGGLALALGALSGAVSIYVESALAFFAAFLIGAGGASRLRWRNFAAHEAWALGLVPAALLWWAATQIAQPAYQAQLQKRVAALARAAGADPAGVEISGRDILATLATTNGKTLETLETRERLLAQIAAAPGVRRVIAAKEPTPAPREDSKSRDETATIAPTTPSPRIASDPKSILAALPAGDLDAATCQRALDAVAALEPVAFPAMRASVDRRAALALDKAAEVIRRCPDATIEVRGHGDDVKAEDPLSRRRALAARRYLRREGVAGRRLVAVGCCPPPEEERRASAIEYFLR
jgi:outer membrane protein OmpA-like peptidoglycan-associated protein